MGDKLKFVAPDLRAMAKSLEVTAAQLRRPPVEMQRSFDMGLAALNKAVDLVMSDIRVFQSSLADRYDRHGSNLDKVTDEYEAVDTSMRELFEDLRDHYGDGGSR
jgi:hypothetical protein